jgi:hypothetical protein
MQIVAAPTPGGISNRVAAARSLAIGVLLVTSGLAIGWLCLGTPLVSEVMPSGRPSAAQVVGGILAWGFAIAVPAIFLVLGLARLASIVEAGVSAGPRRMTPQIAGLLGADHLAATDLVIPGGRRVHELVLGPFGIVVLGDVPPPSITRHVGMRWEIRDERGRWIPIEDPLQRTVRDAERVRSWLATDDRDFLVRVYAAVVTDDGRVGRSPACAVVAPSDLAGWLEALPAQRGLTAERRGHLAELVRSLAAGR